MHILKSIDYKNIYRSPGSFTVRCLTISELHHFHAMVKEETENFGNKNYLMYDSWKPDELFNKLYSHSVHVHEKRHFHDFIESPIAYSFLISAVNDWYTVKFILHESHKKNIKAYQPLIETIMKDPERFASVVGEEATANLLDSDLLHKFFLNPNPVIEYDGIVNLKDDFVNIYISQLTPPIKALRKGDQYFPITLFSIMEGSALLSQLLWILSSNGPDKALFFWNQIDKLASDESRYDYVVSLYALQRIFGDESIINFDCLRAFRSLFRFALMGSVPIFPIGRFQYSLEELKDTPAERFLAIILAIKAKNFQEDFVNNPYKILINIALEIHPDWLTLFNDYKKNLKKNLKWAKRNIQKRLGGLEADVFEQMMKFHLYAIGSDTDEVDKYLDILWSEDFCPHLLEAPIQIYSLDKKDEVFMKVSEEFGDMGKWLYMYILESITYQYLYTSDLNCPFSGIHFWCDKSASSAAVPIDSCMGKCIVRVIMDYMGFK